MSRLRTLVAVLGVTAATVGTTAAAGGIAAASGRPADVILAGSAVPFASHTRPTGDVAGSARLTIEVWLKPALAGGAGVARAGRFPAAVSPPGSPRFRHYLSPAAYTARFGASRGAATSVESWLRGEGFTAITTDSGRSYVRATAPVSKINAAFRVQLKTYRSSASAHADGYALHANDRAVSLPASLAGRVLAVTGLDNAAPILPLEKGSRAARAPGAAPCSGYYGPHMAAGLPRQFGVTSFPPFVCGYSAGQMRSAYRASGTATGKGQTIALVEVGLTPDMFLTLQDYA